MGPKNIENSASWAEMEEYVDKIGNLKPKHFKHKDLGDIKSFALQEIGTHTENLTSQHEEQKVSFILTLRSLSYRV